MVTTIRTIMELYITENSAYIIDQDRYMRLPKQEVPRKTYSPRLEDNKWLPLVKHHVENCYGDGNRLRLFGPGAVFGIITSPILEVKEILPV